MAGFFTLVALGCYKDSSSPSTEKATTKADGVPSNGIAMSQSELSAKADIPIYPGSEVPEGQSKVTPADLETRYELNMVTSDSVDKVAEFYKAKLKLDKRGTSTSADMMGVTPKGELAQIKIETQSGKTHIQAISVDEKKK